MVRLARELGVAPSLIHYFTGSRDDLLSAVMNEALRARAASSPVPTGDWRTDLEALLRHTHDMQLKWKGITTYVTSHNRYRLFQRVVPGQQDYGLVFFDRVGRILQSSGLNSRQAAIIYHLLMLFLTSVASAHINQQEPAVHRNFLVRRLAKIDSNEFPGAAFMMEQFAGIDTSTTFEYGLELFLDAIAYLVAGSAEKAPVSHAPLHRKRRSHSKPSSPVKQ